VTTFGCTMMCEQAAPDQLVRDLVRAEECGFDFSVISDHYQPWLESQGHSGYAGSILGAAAQATERIPLMTYVTCPILRYHPAVVAQKAATMQILSGGRFRLGLGSGESLNEHVVGMRWPSVGERHEILSEAVDIISALFDGGNVNLRGRTRQRGRLPPNAFAVALLGTTYFAADVLRPALARGLDRPPAHRARRSHSAAGKVPRRRSVSVEASGYRGGRAWRRVDHLRTLPRDRDGGLRRGRRSRCRARGDRALLRSDLRR